MPHDQPAPAAAPKAGRNLPAAIAVGALLIAWIVVTLLWWHWGFALFVAFGLAAGSWEVVDALARMNLHAARWPVVIGAPLTVLVSYGLASSHFGLEKGMAAIIAGLALTAIAALLTRMPRGVANFVPDAAASLFVIAYLPMLGSAWTLMLAQHDGAARIISFMMCVVASDTGAYAIGSRIGKHKMVPAISPGKSWEGFVAGIVTAMLVGAALGIWVLQAPWWIGVLLGAVMAATGTVGDLIESMIKRDAGLKDMSHLLPGHGGAMDRLDSMLISVPVAWLLLYLLVP